MKGLNKKIKSEQQKKTIKLLEEMNLLIKKYQEKKENVTNNDLFNLFISFEKSYEELIKIRNSVIKELYFY